MASSSRPSSVVPDRISRDRQKERGGRATKSEPFLAPEAKASSSSSTMDARCEMLGEMWRKKDGIKKFEFNLFRTSTKAQTKKNSQKRASEDELERVRKKEPKQVAAPLVGERAACDPIGDRCDFFCYFRAAKKPVLHESKSSEEKNLRETGSSVV